MIITLQYLLCGHRKEHIGKVSHDSPTAVLRTARLLFSPEAKMYQETSCSNMARGASVNPYPGPEGEAISFLL